MAVSIYVSAIYGKMMSCYSSIIFITLYDTLDDILDEGLNFKTECSLVFHNLYILFT